MRLTQRLSTALFAPLALALLLAATPADAHSAGSPVSVGSVVSPGLPLGAANLPETRTSQPLAPGLTLTTITRGRVDPTREYWTIGVNLPVGAVTADPDPDAPRGALGSLIAAQQVREEILASAPVEAELAARGWKPRIEAVDWAPKLPHYPGGLVGYTLRLGRFDTAPTSADPLWAALAAAKFSVYAVYTGQDGRPSNTGPWVIRTVTLDPKLFHGKVESTLGDAVSGRETTSAMAQKSGALYAINGGFFVISTADGTPGIPAGLSVVNGQAESAATNGRVALLLRGGGQGTRITKLSSHYTVKIGSTTHPLDGLNRVPGIIRNCGGVGGDLPTQRPVQDFTCTDPNEVVALTPHYGAPAPAGPGVEAVVDASGRVSQVRDRTGAPVPTGSTLVQAIGTDATWLSQNATVGARVKIDTEVVDGAGHRVHFGPADSVVNGGPQLVRNGQVHIDAVAEGMIHADPALNLPASALGAAWDYGWLIRDNPRTGVGVDAKGRLLFVQADGRQANLSQGLSIEAFAEVMKSLGAVTAINLDGGGSSATVIDGRLVSSPSDVDANGLPVERADGDAILVIPAK